MASVQQAKPLRRRGEALRQAVLDAAVDEVTARGIDNTSVATVAARAGVHETSVYRRFGTRSELLLAASLERAARNVAVPDTGALRTDLIALARSIGAYLQSPIGAAMLRAAVGTDALPRERETFWNRRLESLAPVVERAVSRGELPDDADARLIIESVTGPLHSRALLTRRRIDDEFTERLVDLVLDGCRCSDTG